MPQLDKELFIDYIFYILIVLIHLYTSSQINKNVIRIYSRKFLLKNFLIKELFYRRQAYIIRRICKHLFNDLSFEINPYATEADRYTKSQMGM